jgi:nicotinate-nucleotide adenylyltransferase
VTRAEADLPERIGILGGTFDPVHVGHLMDAVAARHQLGLDRVLVVVARDPWQKHDRVIAPAAIRYEMLVAALDGVEGLEASRIELERDGPTYTIDTVEALTAPRRELFLVVGSDVAEGLSTWHRVDELRDLVTLAIVDRETVPFPVPDGWRVARVEVPRLELSSTDLRRRVAAGEPIDFLVPTAAARMLRAHDLYRA